MGKHPPRHLPTLDNTTQLRLLSTAIYIK